MPVVSIIVPVYNVEPYIEACIRSVMQQSYAGEIECIIVDDCGSDNSMAIVESLIKETKSKISFNVIHHERNRGLSAARNTGMTVAKGDYYYFLDSDDALTADCIQKLSEPLCNNWYDIVVGDLIIDGGDESSGELKLRLPDNTILHGLEIIKYSRKYWNSMAQNKLYRAEFLKSSNLAFLEGIVHEDDLWSFQVACMADTLCVVRKPTYVYRVKQNGIIATTKQKVKSQCLAIIVKEMRNFTTYHNCYNEFAHNSIQNIFYITLKSYDDFSQYYHTYVSLHPYVAPTLKILLKSNKYDLLKYFRDFHYLLPICFAPYWQYLIISIFKKIKNA